MSRISPGGQLGDSEADYRAFYYKSDVAQVTNIIALWALVYLSFVWRDWSGFSGQPQLPVILFLRIGHIVFSLLFIYLLRFRIKNYRTFDRLVLLWGVTSVANAVAYYRSYGDFSTIFYLVDLVAVISYYVGIPNRLSIRVIPPLLYTLYVALTTFEYSYMLDRASVILTLFTFTGTNIVAILLTVSYYSIRRKEFHARQKEAAARVELQLLASTDSLTGVFNRRRLLEIAEEAFYRYKRYGRPFSIVMMDLDGFKRVNDTYGHQQGDQTLVQFSRLVTKNKRLGDALGRMGGDEFCLVLPESLPNSATRLAERLLHECSMMEVNRVNAFDIILSVSMGITEARPSDASFDQMLARADQALYNAKARGRNRWVVL